MEVVEVMRCVLLCIVEVVEGAVCLLEALEVPDVMRCVLLCMLEVPEVMRHVLLCMLEAADDGLCLWRR